MLSISMAAAKATAPLTKPTANVVIPKTIKVAVKRIDSPEFYFLAERFKRLTILLSLTYCRHMIWSATKPVARMTPILIKRSFILFLRILRKENENLKPVLGAFGFELILSVLLALVDDDVSDRADDNGQDDDGADGLGGVLHQILCECVSVGHDVLGGFSNLLGVDGEALLQGRGVVDHLVVDLDSADAEFTVLHEHGMGLSVGVSLYAMFFLRGRVIS